MTVNMAGHQCGGRKCFLWCHTMALCRPGEIEGTAADSLTVAWFYNGKFEAIKKRRKLFLFHIVYVIYKIYFFSNIFLRLANCSFSQHYIVCHCVYDVEIKLPCKNVVIWFVIRTIEVENVGMFLKGDLWLKCLEGFSW